jgi:L-threonylcarbamoyladenylate synthase
MFEFDFIQELVTTLENGGLILYPTDTVWAIGCDATNPDAVAKVLALKQRKKGKGLILLASDSDMIGEYVNHIPPRIDTLLMYHTRPLTVIYEEGENLPEAVFGKKNNVAFRIVQDDFCKKLIEKIKKPLVATTANVDNTDIPMNFGSISSDIVEGVDYIVRYRREDKKDGELSVIAYMGDDGELAFLRD